MDCMVLSQLFPSCGIAGVVEEPVYGVEIDVLRGALDTPLDEEVLFNRLVELRGRARDWFLPGDVVCRRIGLDEERSDVLRRMQDKVYLSKRYDSSLYEEELESLRREALEHHQWKVHRSDHWLSVIDPQGRALVVVHHRAYQRWRKVMEQLVPRRNTSKAAKTPSYRVSAAWCSLRVLHRHFMENCGSSLSMRDLSKSELIAAFVYNSRVDIGRVSGVGRIIKMYKFRSVRHDAFWERCFRMMDSGDSVPGGYRYVLMMLSGCFVVHGGRSG
jgi:hypothetical protein